MDDHRPPRELPAELRRHRRMFTLLTNVHVYFPKAPGSKDILLWEDRIISIGENPNKSLDRTILNGKAIWRKGAGVVR